MPDCSDKMPLPKNTRVQIKSTCSYAFLRDKHPAKIVSFEYDNDGDIIYWVRSWRTNQHKIHQDCLEVVPDCKCKVDNKPLRYCCGGGYE